MEKTDRQLLMLEERIVIEIEVLSREDYNHFSTLLLLMVPSTSTPDPAVIILTPAVPLSYTNYLKYLYTFLDTFFPSLHLDVRS